MVSTATLLVLWFLSVSFCLKHGEWVLSRMLMMYGTCAMPGITTVKDFAYAIKMGACPILIDGWLLGVAVDAVRRPLWWLAILPLSGIVGALVAVGVFLLFFFSKWILLLVGLLLLNGESINLWSKILFCMKVGALIPPAVVVAYTAHVLVTVLLRCGGISAFGKIRRAKVN